MKFVKIAVTVIIAVCFILWGAFQILSSETIEMGAKVRENAPGKFIKLSDGVTHYQLSGPEDGEVVVLVPGATLPIWVWKDLDDKLVKAGYRVLTYDLFGRGYSDRPDAVYNTEFHYRQLKELTDKVLPGKRFHFVNLTLGAIFTSEYIVRHPKRVKSMLTIGPDGFGLEAKASTRVLLKMPAPVRSYIFSVLGNRILMARLPNYSRDPKVVKELKALYHPTLKWKGFKRAIISTVVTMPITDARSLYQRATETGVPIMLVWGDQDLVTPYPGEKTVRDAFSKSEIRILPKLGHLPHYEDVEAVAQVITEFVGKNE